MSYSKGRKIYITFSATALLAVLITIFCLSAQNGEESSDTSSWVMDLIISVFGKAPEQDLLRTFAHFCEFAGLGFLTANFIYSLKDKPKPLLTVLFSWGYAWTDEIHQIFVPERAFQLIDLTVDLGGIVLGTAIFCGIIIIMKTIKNTKKPLTS